MSACGPFYSMRNLRLITDKPVVWVWLTADSRAHHSHEHLDESP